MIKRNSKNGQWERGNQNAITHGATVGGRIPRLFKALCAMRDRCHNPMNVSFDNYGGRGIKVCERWNNYQNFFDDVGNRPPGMSLGRIDNDGDYCPENCRWETSVQQANNKRSVPKYEHNGRALTATEWSLVTGIRGKTIKHRISRGWPLEKALTTPLWIGINRAGNKRGPYRNARRVVNIYEATP